MGEFFKGWRRKAGILALVLACVFAAAWVRSLGTRDDFSIATGELSMRSLMMFRGSVAFVSLQEDEDTEVFVEIRSGWHSDPIPSGELHPLDPLNRDYSWRWKGFGFSFGKAVYPDELRIHLVLVPLWSLALTPTLLSAYLLLTKPRVAKPKIVCEN